MKQVATLTGTVAIVLWPIFASAGIIINQQTSVRSTLQSASGDASGQADVESIVIQGNKEKITSTQQHAKAAKFNITRITLTDLDKGKVSLTDPISKTFFEADFPPQGKAAEEAADRFQASVALKKTGTSRIVAGIKCEEYTGKGTVKSTGDHYVVSECIAKDAPGAAEFTAFRKRMLAELKVKTATMPEGVPVQTKTTTELGNAWFAALSPQRAEEFKKRMANQPLVAVRESVVTKIEAKEMPADTFEIPAGYTKREPPKKPSTAASSSASPSSR